MLESFQNYIGVFLSCSNVLGKGPPQIVGLKSCCNCQILWLHQRGGVWRGKHHSDIEMKISIKRRMSGNITNNKQNFESMLFSKQYFSISVAKQLERASWKRSWAIRDVSWLLQYTGSVFGTSLKAFGFSPPQIPKGVNL